MAYKLTHPDSNLTVEAERDMVSTYVSAGWETARGVKAPAVTDEPAPDVALDPEPNK